MVYLLKHCNTAAKSRNVVYKNSHKNITIPKKNYKYNMYIIITKNRIKLTEKLLYGATTILFGMK